MGEHGLERRRMALALQADCFTSDLSQLIIADVMSGSVLLDASTSIWGGWPSWVCSSQTINCSPMPTHPILQWMVNDLLTINFISG
jgi:hypothetical protein